MCQNKTFGYLFFLDYCPCLVKICAYSHVTIKQMIAVDYYIEVVFMSIFILKGFISTYTFSDLSSLQAF